MNANPTPQTKNYEPWLMRPIAKFSSQEEFLKHLVSWAILAASTHNTQPWKIIIKLRNSLVGFCLDRKWVLPASDKIGRQAIISMGCALQNFLSAAKYYGAFCEADYPLAMSYPLPLFTIRVGEPSSATTDSGLMDAMRNRRMNRNEFSQKRKVPLRVIEEIQKAASEFGLAINIITDRLTCITMAGIQKEADEVVIAMDEFRNELGEYLLPNDTLSMRGMPGATFCLDDKLSQKIHKELLKQGEFDPVLADAFPAVDFAALKSAPAIFIISVPEDTPINWITSGRLLERTALIAEREGLSVSIHAAMVEVESLNILLKARLGRFFRRITVIGRLGYSEETLPPHAPRANLEEVCEIRQ